MMMITLEMIDLYLDCCGQVILVIVVDSYHGEASPDQCVSSDVEVSAGSDTTHQHQHSSWSQPPQTITHHTPVTTDLIKHVS